MLPCLADCFLYFCLFSHLVAFPSGGYHAPRAYAVFLVFLYCLFMLLACLAESGLIDLGFLCTDGACPDVEER